MAKVITIAQRVRIGIGSPFGTESCSMRVFATPRTAAMPGDLEKPSNGALLRLGLLREKVGLEN
jgi:hypothetical protein